MKKAFKFIGDVHGKLEEYRKIILTCEASICVGDFGFKKEWLWHYDNVWNRDIGSHYINPGNHDWYDYTIKPAASTGNWNYLPWWKIFTVRGADSIDKHLRREGVDWFPNEELSYMEGIEVLDHYLTIKPRIVVSHDCPQKVMERFFGYNEKSTTRQLLQVMFEQHQPELWVFGHHHQHKDEVINGTRFVCLDELETLEL